MDFGLASAVGLDETIGGEDREPRVRRAVLERPQALLGPAQRLFRALVLVAELGELEVFPGRRQVLGAQLNPRLDIAVALGEAVENARESVVVAFGCLPPAAAELRKFLPRLGRKPAIFGQTGLAESVGIEPGRAAEGSVAL